MAGEPIDASVVLTTDNSQYDASMAASAAQTDQFAKSVDSLGAKIDKLSKAAGKKMLGLAGVDAAAITALTASYAAYEKQMESLSAQAAVLNRTTSEQERTFKSYEGAVNSLRGTFAMSTREAAGLVQQLSSLSDGTQNVDKLATTFGKLAAVSGEAPQQLAQSVLQLQRTMGMPQRETERFANTLTNLAARTNTTVTGIAEFSQSIGPMARQVGMTANEVAGVSTAFIRAGQDGYQAANAFNKILGDISYATATGSPDLAKYANLIGVTVENFKSMDKTEAVTQIFETLNRQGPQAITTLNRLGLDGLRTQRAITALAQGGGLRGALREAQGGDPDALNRGSKEAMDGIVDSLNRTRVALTKTAEEMGANFAGPAKGFVTVVEGMAKALQSLANSPLGDIAAWIMGLAGPLAGAAGGMMLMAKGVLAFAGANQLLRSSFGAGIRAGRRGSIDIGSPDHQMATGQGGAVQRLGHLWGQRLGGLFGPRDPNSPSAMARGASWTAGRALQGGGLAARLLGYAYLPGVHNPFLAPDRSPMSNPTLRQPMITSPTFRDALRNGGTALTGALFSDTMRLRMEERGFERNPTQAGQMRVDAARAALAANAQKMAQAMDGTTKGFGGVQAGLRDFRSGLGFLAKNMMGATAGALHTGGSMMARAGRWGFEQLGGSWLTAGLLGYGLYEAWDDDTQYKKQDMSGSGTPYLQAAGLTGAAKFSSTSADLRKVPSSAREVRQGFSGLDQFAATNRDLSNSALKGMSQDEAVAYLGSQYQIYRNKPQAMDELKLDLMKLYGSSGAYTVMQKLEFGSRPDASSTFYDKAFTDMPRRSFLGIPGLRSATRESIGDQINLGLGVDQDRINLFAQRYGIDAGFSESSKAFESFVGDFGAKGAGQRWYDKILNLGGIGGSEERLFGGFNKMTGEEEAWLDALKDNFGLTSFSKDDYRDIREELDAASSKREAFTVFLKAVFEDEKVNSEERQQLLSRFGVKDPTLEGKAAVDAILDAQKSQYTPQAIDDEPGTVGYEIARIKGSRTVGGRSLIKSGPVQKALNEPENRNAQLAGIRFMYSSLNRRGMDPGRIQEVFGQWRAAAGEETDPAYQLAAGAQEYANQMASWQMPSMGRTQQFGFQTNQFASRMRAARGDVNQEQLQMQAMQDMFGWAEEQRQYFQGLLYQQREYNVMRSRAEEDYNLQRQYAQEDYHRSRMWQEEDYNLARFRANRNFNIAMQRGQRDFNISRRRQEQDHQHQIVLMAENAAKQMHNIYERVAVQRTSSAEFMVYNAQDQLERMREQAEGLDELRRRGMSNRTISQLQLNDPNNAQQLQSMLGDIRQNPELVQRFNRIIMQRIRAARDLVTEESSTEWREFMRQYRLNRNRATADYRKVTKDARENQRQAMEDMEKDYRKQLNRGQIQYETVMDRQAKAYSKTMRRSAEDLNRAAKEITGNFEEMLTKATKRLGGMAGRQAQAVLSHFQNLKGTVVPEAVDLMKLMAIAFKVDYKVPDALKRSGNATIDMARGVIGSRGGAKNLNELLGGGDGATGGVVPGWSPGVDNNNYVGPGGQKLSLSGGEAIMRPEFTRAVGGEQGVKALNQAAIHNRFFLGGVMPTQASSITRHRDRKYAGKTWAGDLNDPGSGDMGDPVKAWKAGTVAKVLDIGDRSYGRYIVINHPGGQNSLYAHLSRATVRPGDKVGAGDLIGNVGSYGRSSGPHLHFEVDGGSVPIGGGNGYGGGGGAMRLSDIIKRIYPKPERAALAMSAMRPLDVGDISKIINRFARRRWEKWADQYGQPGGFLDGINFGDWSAPSGMSNVALGKSMASKVGWGSGGYWEALYKLWMAESNWNHRAENPSSGAYGIPQSLPASKMASAGSDWRTNPATQIEWGLRYIKDRYGGPVNAWKWHQRHNWYGDGAVFSGAQTIGVGERGPEAVIPLNERGAEFVSAILEKSKANYSDVRGTHTAHYGQPIAHNLYNTYKIDKSTTFTGEIKVVANNPNEFLEKMRMQKRTAALTQPQLASA